MFETTEVRWFYKSTTWPHVEAWFKKGLREATVEPFRVDYYLSMPLEEELGIKVRDGRLEIKRRVQDDGTHSFSDRISGHISTWRKWSFPLGNSDQFLESAKEPWIKVGKDRLVRKFSVAEHNQIDEIDPRSPAVCGCIFEFARLNVTKDSFWCSIGLEAFGDYPGSKRNTVKSVLSKLLDETGGPVLPVDISMDYPSWLSFLHMSSSKP
jgi:hypothetical protein